jgi:hypothetical protein
MAGERTVELECKWNLAFLMIEGGGRLQKRPPLQTSDVRMVDVHKHIGFDNHAL